jgi:hypothetical protein
MRLFLVLVLVLVPGLGCKDDTGKPKAPPPTATQPEPASPPAPDPAPPAEEPPAPATRSQQALATRQAALTRVAVIARKYQGDCAALSSAAVTLGNELRATAEVRIELDPADAAAEQRQMEQVLAIVLKAGGGCEPAALEPITAQLSDNPSSR